STGPSLDTAYITGNVKENFTGNPSKNYTVALFHSNYTDYPDSLIFPLYISKTSESGDSKLSGLKPQAYSIYAFNDINTNLIVDPGEEMAFLTNSVKAFDTLQLYSAPSKRKKPYEIYSAKALDQYCY